MILKWETWKNWDPKKYCEEVGKINWAPLLAETNIDVINSIFEDNLLEVMDKIAPEKMLSEKEKLQHLDDRGPKTEND